MTGPSHRRPAWVDIDVGALRHNAATLAALCAPARLCAVVKADGYGHGATVAARAAVAGGASWLAVATVDEGIALRTAGLDVPILLLSEPPTDAMADAHAHGLIPTLYTPAGVAAARRAAAGPTAAARRAVADRAAPASAVADRAAADRGPEGWEAGPGVPAAAGRWAVHVKVDTGMHRVGCDPPDLAAVAGAVAAAPELTLHGLWTHLAVSDDPSDEAAAFTAEQLRRFEDATAALAAAGLAPVVRHAANTAGTLVHPAGRLDMVRCGIGLYGLAPSGALASTAAAAGLRPALSWRARVVHVRRLPSGSRPSYGRVRPLERASTVAVVPVGYADGLPRRALDSGCTVLIGGRRRPLAGVVTMDQVVVDCGDDPVAVGDEVVVIGEQQGEVRTAWAWADELGTIAYEVVCGIGPRVPRLVVGDIDHGAVPTGPVAGRAGSDVRPR